VRKIDGTMAPYLIVATTTREGFDPAAMKDALETVAQDFGLCSGGKEMIAVFVRSTLNAVYINNALAGAKVPGLLYFVVMELGRDWFCPDRLPAAKWLVSNVGARNP
jgi:hypothetical protein